MFRPVVVEQNRAFFPARMNTQTKEVHRFPLLVAEDGFTYERVAFDLATIWVQQTVR